MTITKLALAAIVLAGGLAAAGAASAAAPSAGHFSPDGIEKCSFEADLGRYVCQNPSLPDVASLSDDLSGPSKGKITIQAPQIDPTVSVPNFP